jgi:hypothetical protein
MLACPAIDGHRPGLLILQAATQSEMWCVKECVQRAQRVACLVTLHNRQRLTLCKLIEPLVTLQAHNNRKSMAVVLFDVCCYFCMPMLARPAIDGHHPGLLILQAATQAGLCVKECVQRAQRVACLIHNRQCLTLCKLNEALVTMQAQNRKSPAVVLRMLPLPSRMCWHVLLTVSSA